MRVVESCESRLKSMIVMDKQETPQKINKILKSELIYVLRNYFEICAEDLSLDISVMNTGKYEISIRAESKNIKIAHVFSD